MLDVRLVPQRLVQRFQMHSRGVLGSAVQGTTHTGSATITFAPMTLTATGDILVRQFPTSASAWTAAFPAITAPTHIWTFQESATPILDKVGSNNLVENAALLYAQTGDTQPLGAAQLSTEFDTTATTEWTGPADTTIGDIGVSGALSLYVRFRMPDNVATARSLMGKGTTTAVTRWGLNFSTGGLLQAILGFGATQQTLPTVSTYDDSAYHDAIFALDPAADLLWIITETEAVSVAVSAATVTGWDSVGLAPAAGLHFGSALNQSVLAGTRISYAALFNVVLTSANLATIRTQQ